MEHEEIYSAEFTRKTADLLVEYSLLNNPAFLAFIDAMKAVQQNMVRGILLPASDPAAAIRQEYDKGTVNGIGIAIGWAAGIVESAKKINTPGQGSTHQDEDDFHG